MKLYKPKFNNIIKKILFVELILLFSLASSFLILAFMEEKEENPDTDAELNYLVENFRSLKSFLYLDLENYAASPPTETAATNIANPLITALLKLKTAETLPQEGKDKNLPALLKDIDTKYDFIADRKRELYLKYLYDKKSYQAFIELFDEKPLDDSGASQKIARDTKLQLIHSLLKTNNRDRAFNIFRELFETTAVKHFKKFIPGKELTYFLSQLNHDDWYKKFYFLVENNRSQEFSTEKKYVAAPSLTDLIDAEFYYRRRKYGQALAALKQVNTGRLLSHKKKLIIKIDLRQDNYDNILAKVDELKNEKEIYSRLLLDCAGILLMKGEPGLAAQLFEKYLALGNPDDPDYHRILWVTAWLYYRQDDKEKAVDYFRKGSNSQFPAYKIANSYWLYRLTGENAGNILDHPFSYYFTRISQDRVPQEKRVSKNFLHYINGKQSDRLREATNDLKAMLLAGMAAECPDYIDWICKYEPLSQTDKNLLKIIESIVYLKQHNYHKAFVRFRENFPGYINIVLPGSLCSIYTPIRFKSLIDKYAAIYNLDSMLLLALIREETMFKVDAVSSADAIGLMQLMYGTARQMAKGEGFKIRKADLFNPEINIRLGCKYFRFLLDKYNGQVHLALAGYNAGDDRVDRWLAEFGPVDADEFIEMIPFSDTRNYVKNIIRTCYYYRYYYEN